MSQRRLSMLLNFLPFLLVLSPPRATFSTRPKKIETDVVDPEQREVWMDSRYPWTFDNDLFGAPLHYFQPGSQVAVVMFSWWMTACFYPCVFGPDFWGLVHKNWRMCSVGRLQSPINIDPVGLLFDPHLTRLDLAKQTAIVEAMLVNTGQLPLVILGSSEPSSSATEDYPGLPRRLDTKFVNVSGGPAYPYTYQMHQVVFHYARQTRLSTPEAESEGGSEHTIDGVQFPGEVQIMAFNSDLYENFSQAMFQPRGLLGISIIVNIGDITNPELRKLTIASQSVTYKKSKASLRKFHPHNLLPKHHGHYVTYEGSLTYPGCYESVTWVVMNNPIYITKDDLAIWGELQQAERDPTTGQQRPAGAAGAAGSTPSTPPLYISPNNRPIQPENGRLVRTNINVEYKSRVASSGGGRSDTCPSNIYLDMGYRANAKRAPANASAAHGGKLRVLPEEVMPRMGMKRPLNDYVHL